MINVQMWILGYEVVFKEVGQFLDEVLIFEVYDFYWEGYDLIEKVLESGVKVVFVFDDGIVVGLLNGLIDYGSKVLVDFELIVVNDIKLMEIIWLKMILVI